MSDRPTWLNDHNVSPVTTVQSIAVGIEKVREDQMHAAILYRDPLDGKVYELHFCWMPPNGWRGREARNVFDWVNVRVTHVEAMSIATACKQIVAGKTLEAIDFSFRYDGKNMLAPRTGKLTISSNSHGLTCATFVLTLLSNFGVHLLSVNDWPRRPCDEIWQRDTLRQMRQQYGDARVEPQSKEIGSKRYRPEEVVAACSYENPPTDFQNVLVRGREVLQAMGSARLSCWYDAGCALSDI